MAPFHIRSILGSTDNLNSEFIDQWTNPTDIFSLLLLIGGDTVQKAIAQLVGIRMPLTKGKNSFGILLTPVAFSFGWVAYAFTSLKDLVGEGSLMPESDIPCQVINCSTGYSRNVRSWILGRVLRDHQNRNRVNRKEVAIQIDIFDAVDQKKPDIDLIWWSSWATILIQQVIAAIPWLLYGDWTKSLVTLCGTAGALAVGMFPQWENEKWAARRLEGKSGDKGKLKTKITALTRGNGHPHVMVFINKGYGWDVEGMASASCDGKLITRYLSLLMTIWWTLLLITCSGLRHNTWYLVCIGGLGMLQNIFVSGVPRDMGSFNFHYKHRSRIAGVRKPKTEIKEAEDSDPEDIENPLQSIGGVMGAMMEVEKKFPGVGASLVTVFFPAGFGYDDGNFHFARERKFWKFAHQTMKERKREMEEAEKLGIASGVVTS